MTPVIKRIDVVPARPESGDTRSLDSIAKREAIALEPCVWLVVLSLEQLPEPTGRTLFLQLGDYRIDKYWSFAGGIYFKVYNPRFFTKYAGRPFSFVSEDGEQHVTNQRLPAHPTQAARMDAQALPTQRAALLQLGPP